MSTLCSDVPSLNEDAFFNKLSMEEKAEVYALANSINVKEIDKVMHYGEIPLKATFEQCGAFLKDERGSLADQEVIAEVVKLSKKAHEVNEEFNLVLKEPSFLQSFIMSLSKRAKLAHNEKMQKVAVSNYSLLLELTNSYDSWIEVLKNSMAQTEEAMYSDVETASLLEKYIIAGNIAIRRIEREFNTAKENYEQTGLLSASKEYEELKEGLDIFKVKMLNLERSRAMYHLSLGQLSLIKRSNRDVQIAIYTQKNNSMALMSQQLRNAVLNEKNKEVLEGQKAISGLNNELIMSVSKLIGLTAEESERLIYSSFYNVEAAKTAVTAVIESCDTIKKTAEEMLPKLKADTKELNLLVNEIENHIYSINATTSEMPKIQENAKSDNKLSF